VKKFHFPLDRLLELRKIQQDAEQVKLDQLLHSLQGLDARREQLRGARQSAEKGVRQEVGAQPAVHIPTVEVLGPFRRRIARAVRQLDAERAQLLTRVAQQRKSLLEARQRREVLEKFREKGMSEWRREAAREQESLAAEIFLAKWSRRSTGSKRTPS
jgi:flagellar export protein FliJ